MRRAMRDSVHPTSVLRYSGKGIPAFRSFMESRGWSTDWDVNLYLEGPDGHPIPRAHAVTLLTVYTEWLKGEGRNPTTFVQALRKDFETQGRSVDLFDAGAIREARKLHWRWDGREVAAKKLKPSPKT
jgi:hypothetical protein